MPTEPLPINEWLTDVDNQWTYSNVSGTSAKPAFVEVTGADEPMRFSLNVNDHFVGRAGSPALEETPIGNWKYGNRSYTVNLEIWTLRERQRLYNIMQEIRRICHARMHSLTNFQRIQFMSFDEMTTDTVNVWTGNSQISLENSAVLLLSLIHI